MSNENNKGEQMSSTVQQVTMDRKTINRNRLKLIAIFGVALIPVLLAMAMYFGGWAIPQSKTNKGNLLWPPVELNLLDLNNVAAVGAMAEEDGAKWSLMITGGATCSDDCEALLHEVRQVNVAMGREAERVGRMLVSGLVQPEAQHIQQRYPNMQIIPVKANVMRRFLEQAETVGAQSTSEKQWQVWLVDPLGNVILQYTEDHDGYDLMDDLKRLLKLSKIG